MGEARADDVAGPEGHGRAGRETNEGHADEDRGLAALVAGRHQRGPACHRTEGGGHQPPLGCGLFRRRAGQEPDQRHRAAGGHRRHPVEGGGRGDGGVPPATGDLAPEGAAGPEEAGRLVEGVPDQVGQRHHGRPHRAGEEHEGHLGAGRLGQLALDVGAGPDRRDGDGEGGEAGGDEQAQGQRGGVEQRRGADEQDGPGVDRPRVEQGRDRRRGGDGAREPPGEGELARPGEGPEGEQAGDDADGTDGHGTEGEEGAVGERGDLAVERGPTDACARAHRADGGDHGGPRDQGRIAHHQGAGDPARRGTGRRRAPVGDQRDGGERAQDPPGDEHRQPRRGGHHDGGGEQEARGHGEAVGLRVAVEVPAGVHEDRGGDHGEHRRHERGQRVETEDRRRPHRRRRAAPSGDHGGPGQREDGGRRCAAGRRREGGIRASPPHGAGEGQRQEGGGDEGDGQEVRAHGSVLNEAVFVSQVSCVVFLL